VGDSVFLRACRGQPVPHTPVWFMRQAGRSLPEYRALRKGIPMLESCTRPELVTEITLQPVHRYGVDAAILYSDIMVPLKAVGVDLDIVSGVGPVIASPVRSADDLRQRPILEGLAVARRGHFQLAGAYMPRPGGDGARNVVILPRGRSLSANLPAAEKSPRGAVPRRSCGQRDTPRRNP